MCKFPHSKGKRNFLRGENEVGRATVKSPKLFTGRVPVRREEDSSSGALLSLQGMRAHLLLSQLYLIEISIY